MDPDAVRTTDRVPHGGSDDPEELDFSANTNTEIPPGTEAVYREAFSASRRYPNDAYPEFRAAAAEYVECGPEQIVPTPGGLAAIRLAIETTVDAGESVLVPTPSFGEYAREVELQGADPAFVSHDRLLDADPADHALAIVCTPNNPTGEAYDPDALREFAARCRDVDTRLLVDEAFLGFTDIPSLAGEEGVIVARSLTKLFGLPGLRAGFAVATGDERDTLQTARRAWNLGTPAAAVGAHCLRADEFVAETRRRIEHERERMRETLSARYDVHPSDSPFLLLDVGEGEVDDLLAHAHQHGIALRDARTFRELDSHVRVAMKDSEANDRLLEVLVNA
ncbi:aminotransferase class I/II-fold pyridoxal phosphate-dependent enzyme [Natranaeroarchaeum aerophilus]|uniref:Aminotransferase n=1 Tax=Natranaeroarchaeum aerophilus TaxID=2917711 RepID=A0AAE3K801_9EURY|nr:aminotransferase class I/II-fold pyridoxal phosphate-dependent enzyme [Natranaeroarchaeum aerophilus]MCL9814484.1 aminotransferase class I/II-fold pyridoxal phosphate-dependent enzyme [Natranaeroarchaeum aerophilus]